jgi:hypothetical protein
MAPPRKKRGLLRGQTTLDGWHRTVSVDIRPWRGRGSDRSLQEKPSKLTAAPPSSPPPLSPPRPALTEVSGNAGQSARKRKRPASSPPPPLSPQILSSLPTVAFPPELTARVETALKPFLRDDVRPSLAVQAVASVLPREFSFVDQGTPPTQPSAELASAPSVDVAALVAAFPFADNQSLWPPVDTTGFSQAKKELVEVVTPTIARNTLLRVAEGYKHRTSNNLVPPASTNTKGCWLASGTPNKGGAGHIAVRPVVPPSGTRVPDGAPRTPRRQAQFIHRLAVKAWFEWADVQRMYPGGPNNEVSHLCGEAQCFKPGHIVIESHSHNEKRKHANTECKCIPSCIAE